MSKTKKKKTNEEINKLLDEDSIKFSNEDYKKYIDDETGEERIRKTDNDYSLTDSHHEYDEKKSQNDFWLRRRSKFCYLPGTNYYFLSYTHNTDSEENYGHIKWVRSQFCTYQTVQNFMDYYGSTKHMNKIQGVQIFDEQTLNEVVKFKEPDGTFTEEMTLREGWFGNHYQEVHEGVVNGKWDKVGEHSTFIENCNR